AAQLEHLTAQLADLLPLLARHQIRPSTLVRLDLTHVLAQRLRRHTEISRDVRDRTTRLEHQPRAALQQLHRVLPHSWHDSGLLLPPGEPWHRSLRQTRDGSVWCGPLLRKPLVRELDGEARLPR